jgi:hypothetical protein
MERTREVFTVTFEAVFEQLAGRDATGKTRQPWSWQTELAARPPRNGRLDTDAAGEEGA